MKKTESAFTRLRENKLTALLSPKSEQDCVVAYETFDPMGILLEIALRTPVAIQGIRAVLAKYPNALVLAGTVMTTRQAEQAIEAGVAGVISADYIADVVRVCIDHDIMCIPGGINDVGKQLVQKAHLLGCDLETVRVKYPYQWIFKLFPAITSTVSFIGMGPVLKGPYKNLQVMYTGGIQLQNLPEVVANDPDGIFCGSALTKHIDEPEIMRQEAEAWLKVIRQM